MSIAEPACATLAIGAILVTLWYAHAPTPTVHGDVKPDHTSTVYHGIRPPDAADGTFRVLDDADRDVAVFHVRHDRVSVEPAGADGADGPDPKRSYHTSYERDVYLWDSSLDIGTFAGYSTADTRRFESGVRYGFCRLLYGAVALDAVAGTQAAGAGISCYPPAEYAGNAWAHIGLGCWYVAPYRGGHPGALFGLSFSTHE
jgi:hypothetical protein